MHQLKLSVIINVVSYIIQTFALLTGGKINNFGIKDAFSLQPSSCDLRTTPRCNTRTHMHKHTPTCKNTHTYSSKYWSPQPARLVRHSAAVLMQAELGTLTDQEYSIHHDAHIIKSSKYMNYSQLQICLSSMSLSFYVHLYTVCVCVCICECACSCYVEHSQ